MNIMRNTIFKAFLLSALVVTTFPIASMENSDLDQAQLDLSKPIITTQSSKKWSDYIPSKETAKSVVNKAGKVIVPVISGLKYAVTHPKVTLASLAAASTAHVAYTHSQSKKSLPMLENIFSVLNKGAHWTGVHHKAIVGSAIAAAATRVAYLLVNRKSWKDEIKKARGFTKYLNNPTGLPENKLKYFGLNRWRTGSDITHNINAVYNELRIMNENKHEDENSFIARMRKNIDLEQEELRETLELLDTYLSDCNLLPKIEISYSDEQPYIIDEIIKAQKPELKIRKNRALHRLAQTEMQNLNKSMINVSSPSYINPYKIARQLIFPYESVILLESWKLRQLIARLDALRYCLAERLRDINFRPVEVIGKGKGSLRSETIEMITPGNDDEDSDVETADK